MNPAELAGWAGLASMILASGKWMIVDRKSATRSQVKDLEDRVEKFRKDNDNYRDQLSECKRNCQDAVERAKNAENRVERLERETTWWQDEAIHWKQMALGGSL